MKTLDQKLHFAFTANQQIIQLVAEIDLFRGKWEHLEQMHPIFLNELKGMTTIQSIGSSTRIEGATLSDVEIEQLIADLKVNKLESRDEQEVVGYYDVLELIFDNAGDIHLTENYLMQLHTLLLRYSTKDSGQKGAYKKVSNKVVASYPDGS